MAYSKILHFSILVISLLFSATIMAQDSPLYLNTICPNNVTKPSSTFQSNLLNLFSSLSSKAKGNTKFYNHTVTSINPSESVYGSFMCRGDIPSLLCQDCIVKATNQLSSACSLSKQAVIWYGECMVRYSNISFFSTIDMMPGFHWCNTANVTNTKSFVSLLFTTMNRTVDEAASPLIGDKNEKFATKEAQDSENQTLYCLAQCTPDLSPNDCRTCLSSAIEKVSKSCDGKVGGRFLYPSCNVSKEIPWSFLGSVGGRILYPSCNLRFELFKFYMDGDEALLPTRHAEKKTIIFIVVPIIILVMLFSIGYFLIKRWRRKSRKTILRENFGEESATLEPLQFDWMVIEAATNNFSKDNYLGKGGFGEVYKGILSDGREVAIKRLSRSSKQGVEEFKNEILLIAKLQHRNLVTFIGFCLEGHEKILIYEYVSNKSLDYFLFDSQQQKLLTWVERFNIIGGIAGGILYLHEHSRLKVIHRDLKPSNILLDENMIPRISDFGLARMVEISQDEGSTNRIVGTYGYMSPEYAMFGQFSEKSDVYSFGVMILEIVAGKKNISSYEPQHVANSLLNSVWRQWMDKTPLNILDPNIKGDYSKTEVIKCIQIGLLCVQNDPEARPSILTIASYLSSHSIELPTPQQPAFFLQGRNYNEYANSSALFSSNGMPSTTFFPR
ncbi:cysteine-rich receptor-like protein kinase 10 isoform X2 [Medicago truncatula]|uniref:cysteine-rich receptor-like protein kinase 10 isoform X2 n=1 Tax=Medicago truncatula TaxID=3880 RepID=UPI000D2F29E5|nr:cysteine-rich receptor-like protein kinase 10 isoform X2 [Medicago truncatula]